MASATDMTAWDNSLKIYYEDRPVQDLVYKNHPFLTLVPKNPNFRGKSMPIPIITGRPQGVSATSVMLRAMQLQLRLQSFCSLVRNIMALRPSMVRHFLPHRGTNLHSLMLLPQRLIRLPRV